VPIHSRGGWRKEIHGKGEGKKRGEGAVKFDLKILDKLHEGACKRARGKTECRKRQES